MTANTDGYQGNSLLKPAGVQQEWTKEQVEEYLKCKDNPVYFAENYMKIVHVDDGLIQFEPYDYQKELIEKVHDNRFTIAMQSRQTGKCFSADTEITVRNKKTGETMSTTAQKFFENTKENVPLTD